jgi:hypothetical protein
MRPSERRSARWGPGDVVNEPEQHEDLSPLHRLRVTLGLRMATNELHAERHPDPNVRSDALVRVETSRLVLSEVDRAIDQAGKAWVDLVVASRAKQEAITSAGAVKAIGKVVV